jgi:Fur family transcriptional regulator, stress-responsive regulator
LNQSRTSDQLIIVTQESPAAEHVATAQLLRAAGLRVTAPRVAVLESLAGQPHADADTVARTVRQRLGTVSTQAVYDVLAALCRTGLVRRIEPAGSPALFERRIGDNHHHVVCRTCGAVEDVECVPQAAACLTPQQTHGFLIDEAEVTFWGFCPRCRRDAAF